MEMLEIKNTVPEMKIAFDGLIRWTKNQWARKKCQQKFPKLKCKGKTKKNRTSKRCNIQVMGILEGKEYLKQ